MQGRAIVRDWFESTVANVARNLSAHFKHLDIVRNAPKPKEHELPPQFPLTMLLKSLAPQGDSERIPPPLDRSNLLKQHCTVLLPVLAPSTRRRASTGGDWQPGEDNDWTDLDRRDARAALTEGGAESPEAVLPETTHYKEVQRDMDPTNLSEGYTLGRLMAVLERIQQEAIGDVNASVVDRYFSGASATPKTVFVRLLKNARHHVTKAKDDDAKAGFVFRLDKLIDELASRFDPKSNGFPAHLDLEQQGLFVLGYHQMRKWLWMSREERSEWEKAHAEAPREYLWSRGRNDGCRPLRVVAAS